MPTVRLFAAARAAVGSAVIEVPVGTVGEICDRLERDHPPFASVRPACSFLLDGAAVRGNDTAVDEGATLDVLPPFAGG